MMLLNDLKPPQRLKKVMRVSSISVMRTRLSQGEREIAIVVVGVYSAPSSTIGSVLVLFNNGAHEELCVSLSKLAVSCSLA